MLHPADPKNERVLLLMPFGRDAGLAEDAMGNARLTCTVCADMPYLCGKLREGAGAAMITEEAFDVQSMQCLREELQKQPPWADLPLIIFEIGRASCRE